jgi:Ca2+-binding EF-hand superfamily protein
MTHWILVVSEGLFTHLQSGFGSGGEQDNHAPKAKEKELMNRKLGLRGTVAFGLFTLVSGACYADDKKDPLPGPIDSISDLEDTAKIVFKLADTNNDGQISQKEAIDAGNLLVGGFFFRADVNGDGVLTQQEAQQARETLFSQQPLLKFVLERAKPTTTAGGNQAQNGQPEAAAATNDPRQLAQRLASDPMQTITNLLDTNHDQKIESSELRQAVQTGVATLYLVADTNQDGQLNMYEINAGIGEIAKSAVQTVFQAADTDRNNMLSTEEFDKALIEPAHAVFRVLDANADNQLSMAELQRAQQIIQDQIQRLRVPDPGNSLANQLRNGSGANRGSQAPYQASPASAPNPR